jgi:hypothetical protein
MGDETHEQFLGTLQRVQMVADRAEGTGEKFHDGILHRREDAAIQIASFR